MIKHLHVYESICEQLVTGKSDREGDKIYKHKKMNEKEERRKERRKEKKRETTLRKRWVQMRENLKMKSMVTDIFR